MLVYIDKNTTMSTWVTECIIPDCTEVVAHLVAWELLYEYEEEDWVTKINHWQVMLDEIFSFYSKQVSDKDKRIVSWNPVRFSQAYWNNDRRKSGNYR